VMMMMVSFAAEQKHVRRIDGDFWGRIGSGWGSIG
jgi:hypothetical protein